MASKIKYEENAADEGQTLDQRRTKAYSMWAARSPAVYKKADYLRWKSAAADALELYMAGKQSYQELVSVLTLPKKKGQEQGC